MSPNKHAACSSKINALKDQVLTLQADVQRKTRAIDVLLSDPTAIAQRALWQIGEIVGGVDQADYATHVQRVTAVMAEAERAETMLAQRLDAHRPPPFSGNSDERCCEGWPHLAGECIR